MSTATAAHARFGTHDITITSPEMGELRDSSDAAGDLAVLHRRLADDGYLMLRGFHDRDEVLAARRAMMAEFHRQQPAGFRPGSDPLDGLVQPGAGGSFGGGSAVSRLPEFLRVVEGRRPFDFFTGLLGGPAVTFDFKWARLVAPRDQTGAHYDSVYMGRGTTRLFTTWNALGDLPYEMGPLALVPGSHTLPGYQKVRDTYGRMDVDRDRVDGWFENDPLRVTQAYGGQWATAEFRAGDVLIFGMNIMHASLLNTSDRYRLTADTRYQREGDPIDERWIGKAPKGHYAWFSEPEKIRKMEAMRQEWGV